MPVADVRGIQIAYEVHGQGDPMLLIMGIGAPLTMWPQGLVGRLADAGFQVILTDHRDVGLSSQLDHLGVPSAREVFLRATTGRRFQAPYTLSDMADDAVGVLDALDIGGAHVVGSSMGGMVAQTLAIEHPDRVRTLTSLMSTTGERAVSWGRPRALKALLKRAPRDPAKGVDHLVGLLRAIGSPGDRFDEETARRRAAASVRRGMSPQGFRRHLGAILVSGDRTRQLQGLELPALVLHGAEDPLIPVRAGRATAAAIPGARLHIIQGMGHELPGWALDAIAQAIIALAGSRSGSRSQPTSSP